MDSIDSTIKEYLEKKAALLPGGREIDVYPTVEDLYLFLADELKGEALKRMLKHLRSHSQDADFVARTREILEKADDSEKENVPPGLMQKAKNLSAGKSTNLACPHCGKPVTAFKKPLGRQKIQNALWFLVAGVSFALSFRFHHYFYQFLLLAALAGVKCIVDQKATKTQILIYKALHDSPGKKDRDLHRLSSHL